tara:strand:- start:696 stop:824 length:129 start_codon:yes stop_codon:yes gene_type:complete
MAKLTKPSVSKELRLFMERFETGRYRSVVEVAGIEPAPPKSL